MCLEDCSCLLPGLYLLQSRLCVCRHACLHATLVIVLIGMVRLFLGNNLFCSERYFPFLGSILQLVDWGEISWRECCELSRWLFSNLWGDFDLWRHLVRSWQNFTGRYLLPAPISQCLMAVDLVQTMSSNISRFRVNIV